MTPEQRRELWLKRILPGLLISVVYFVFISGIVSDKAKSAEDAYRQLMQRGISSAALPGLQSQRTQIEKELADLKEKDKKVQAELSDQAGYLYNNRKGHEAIDRIALLLDNHGLRIAEESINDHKGLSEMPLSIMHIHRWLNDSLKQDIEVPTHRITFIGRYVDVYAMMQQMADENVKALPISLAMADLDEDELNGETGVKKWTLELWI